MNNEEIFKNALGRFKLKRKQRYFCYGCGEETPQEQLTALNEEHPDLLICPTCGFIAGLYMQAGIEKEFKQGDLAISRINNKFRKIAEEFKEDPIATTTKYLKPLTKQISIKTHIGIPDKKIRTFDQFPFIFLTAEQIKLHCVGIGKWFTLQGNSEQIRRRVHYMMKMTPKMSEKYGQATGSYVCFMTED